MGTVVAVRTSHINIEMHFIIFLYLLISSFGDADAERYLPFRGAAKGKPFGPAPPFGSAPPFPSLPAAIHYQDSADIWRKSLGTAKTGLSHYYTLPSGSAIPKLPIEPTNTPIKNTAHFIKAVDYYKYKFLRGRK